MSNTFSAARGVFVLGALAGMACSDAGGRSPLAPTPGAPATRQAAGTVVDTDNRPVGEARLSAGPYSAVSDPDGRFSLLLPVTASVLVNVAASGFEPRGWNMGATPGGDLRIPIARRVVVTPGEPLAVSLTTYDLPYYVGEPYDSAYCRPCKLIRVGGDAGSASSVRRVHLRWTGDVVLGMWASEGTSGLAADVVGPRHLSVVTVGVGENRLLYVGVPLRHELVQPITFSLSVE
jgi:hypothetical protein